MDVGGFSSQKEGRSGLVWHAGGIGLLHSSSSQHLLSNVSPQQIVFFSHPYSGLVTVFTFHLSCFTLPRQQ